MITKKQFFFFFARYGLEAKEFEIDSRFHEATSKTDALVPCEDKIYNNVFHWKYNNGCPQATFIDWDNHTNTSYCDADDFEKVVASYTLKIKERIKNKRIEKMQEDFNA